MSAVRQETKSFQAEIKQLLHIVVHSLYSNKEIFLRELVSNASDAIDKLRFESLTDNSLLKSDPELNIRVSFDAEAKTLTIRDNGIGMSREEVESNLGTIAKSGTKEFLSQLTGDKKKDANLIGQFGVGFYSSFMVADKVTVTTRRAGLAADQAVQWESAGDGEYVIADVEKADRGTDIVLHLKADEDEFLNDYRLKSVINKYSDHLNIPILMQKRDDDGKALDEWEAVNKATALWTLPKNDIKPEQYQEFYKHISHDFDNPLTWVHKKIEGNLDYTALLYLPSHAPFDLWQRDAKHGLKLYVQRVFIMDHVEKLLPHYLRFVKGVLDTSALPLNISREILQDHHTMPKLRSAIVRHVLDLIEKLAKDDVEKYKTFWTHFGNVLKEGPAEDFANRDKVAKLLRFSSTHSSELVSLQDYLSRMKPDQEKIYFITADNLNAAKSSPHLEIFEKKDIEVLLLVDRIDEWVVTHLPEFEGKSLQSVAKGDLSFDDEKKDEAQSEEAKPVVELMKTILGDKVKDVRATARLTSSPVCLVRDQDSLGPQMERLLKAAGQEVHESKPILEINPDHAIIKNLTAGMAAEKQQNWINLLFDQALLAEGAQLTDPADFVKRMNQLWTEVI